MENTSHQPRPSAPQKKKSYWWILWVAFGLIVLLLAGSALALMSSGLNAKGGFGKKDAHFKEQVWEMDEGATDKLALVMVEGVITGQHKAYRDSMADIAIDKINQATEDEDVKGLLLYLNTPGGEVTASDKIYHAAKQFAETGRPIVAYMDTVAASGGYYIACAADEIIATETTITGSIGVILGGMNGKEMLDKVGLKSQTFKSGPFKDSLSMTRDMREDEKLYIQALVDGMYEKFAGIVSEARNIPIEKLRDGIADGRIFPGIKAKEVGLVDETGYAEDALSALKKRAGISKAKTIHYQKDPGLGDLISIMGVKAQQENRMAIDWGQGKFTSNLKPFVPYMVLEGY